MTIKDLLVLLDTTPAAPSRLDAALTLAGALDAHVTALVLVAEPFLRGAVGRHLPEDLLREHLAHARADADAVLAEAAAAAAGRGLRLTPRQRIGSLDRLPHLLGLEARHADLVVVGQPDPEQGGADDALIVEAAFMDSGRPALAVPILTIRRLPPERVLIAWDGSREAARATHDALPFLRLARETVVLIVDPGELVDRVGDPPGADLVAHLAHHGVTARVKPVASGRAGATDTILAQVEGEAVDLLVMGGYGHSRLREMMLGGTTRHMIERMTVPVLLAH